MLNGISAIDLFCGVGGLTNGLIRAGIPVLAGLDIDESCEYAYESNNKTAQFIARSVSDENLSSILNDLYPPGDIKVLVGCAPCQPFSSYTQVNKKRHKDAKWFLINDFMRVIKELEPEVISMENVPSLARQDIFLEFITTLEEKLSYHICAEIVNCVDYGVPQNRKRLVMLASKLGPITILNGHHGAKPKTVRQAIGGLRGISAGETYAEDPLHHARDLAPINMQRIQASIAGGTWRDWPIALRTRCHNKASGATYSSVYARMEWDKPSPTITTQFIAYGTGRFGHPEQDRALSLREGALLQSFPKRYKFFPKNENYSAISAERIARHIGNAVPPKLGWAIGRSIVENIQLYR
jgi:DNA (cytosine-5)-methyltransferase 1